MKRAKLFLTDWLLPMAFQEPIQHAFLIEQNGKILDYGQQSKLESLGINLLEDSTRQKYIVIKSDGPSILMPSLINTHTHISYQKKAYTEHGDEFAWLNELIKESRGMESAQKSKIARQNIKQILQYGCSFIIENTPFEEAVQALAASPLKAIVGWEVFGNSYQATHLTNCIKQMLLLESTHKKQNPNLQFCLSPHSIYNVCPELLKKVFEWSKLNNRFCLIHMAEFAFERALVSRGELPHQMAEVCAGLGVSCSPFSEDVNSQRFSSAISFLLKELKQELSDKVIMTHLIDLDENDFIELEGFAGLLSLCWRSNSFIHRRLPSFDLLDLQKGKNISFGTDGLCSNYSLDPLAEVFYNQQILKQKGIAEFGPEYFLERITSIPAEKLALKAGQVAVNYSADFLMLSWPESVRSEFARMKPYSAIFELNNFGQYHHDFPADESSKYTAERQLWIDGELVV
jgi:cytosine/adenosine deaminase-related metal-dependent hydrolase